MFFCNRRLVRATACYLLLQTLSTVFAPLVALAGNGPMQPEFTSYNPGGSELVDLLTGDFSYTLPLMEVPGPERSFSIPLSYKSGIKLEQEASWMGLGWTLNAGAISRAPNGYPDDAAGDKVQTHFLKRVRAVKDETYIPSIWHEVTDIYTGKKIGNVDVLGLIGFNYDNDGLAGGDIIGIGYQKGEGYQQDMVRLILGVATIATLGTAAAGTTGVEAAKAIGKEAATQLITGVGIAAAASSFGLGKLSGAEGAGNQLEIYKYSVSNTDYTYSLYGRNTNETIYGSLYFGRMSQQTSLLSQYQQLPGLPIPIPRNRIQQRTSAGATIAPVEFINSRSRAMLYSPDGPGTHLDETAADIHQPGGTAYQNVDGPEKPISIAHDYLVLGQIPWTTSSRAALKLTEALL